MTNGEKILNAFPNATTRILETKGFRYIEVEQDDNWIADFNIDWWNAEYKEPATKNDLGVDCISRADAIKAMQDKAKKLTNEDTINGLCGAVAILFDLPSVTPQEPKTGEWKLVQRGKVIDVCCSNCGAVRIKGYAYNYTIDELNKEDINECCGSAEMRYCPNCGSDNRKEQEDGTN